MASTREITNPLELTRDPADEATGRRGFGLQWLAALPLCLFIIGAVAQQTATTITGLVLFVTALALPVLTARRTDR